jgi:hypothetical protein
MAIPGTNQDEDPLWPGAPWFTLLLALLVLALAVIAMLGLMLTSGLF